MKAKTELVCGKENTLTGIMLLDITLMDDLGGEMINVLFLHSLHKAN